MEFALYNSEGIVAGLNHIENVDYDKSTGKMYDLFQVVLEDGYADEDGETEFIARDIDEVQKWVDSVSKLYGKQEDVRKNA